MTIKDKMKTYNFWISVVSAVLLLLRVIGSKYNFEIDSGLVMDVTTGLCGIFVVLGIISAPHKNPAKTAKNNNDVENCAEKSKNNSIIAEIFGGGVVADDAQTQTKNDENNCCEGLVSETCGTEIFNKSDDYVAEVITDSCENDKGAIKVLTQINVEDIKPVVMGDDSEGEQSFNGVVEESEIYCQCKSADKNEIEVVGCADDNKSLKQGQNLYDTTDYTLLTRDELIALIKAKNA